ncbi:hypothetical protein [Arachidicoccus soli]|uniref:Phage major capsid protein n=1 Tax=Arachidicoccus soli TaxID=2341117 RepID=A0A386HRL6_9BACT|nr:hypothetical protein [Arachidicoccus soli]AYD48206.1 hypothetical protein D6B99_11720 [Arachidicoccus soli]
MKKSLRIIASLAFTLLIAVVFSTAFALPFVPTAAVLVVASFVPVPNGVAFDTIVGLNKGIWRQDIIANLYKNNAFAQRAVSADSFVKEGAYVIIPKAGAPTEVKKNLAVFPQVAVQRNDSSIMYEIDTYYALPRVIPNIKKYELSYDLRQSVIGEDQQYLIDNMMQGLLFNWAPGAANIIETTGPATALDLIDTTATGTRLIMDKAQFKQIAKSFANSRLTPFRKTALLTANHYYQLFESFSDAEKTNFNSFVDEVNGIIGKYMDVEIMMRDTVLRGRKTAGVWGIVDTQADDFAATAGDSAVSLFWTENSVERAQGEIDVFDNPGQALYYGDVFSANARLGGRIRRTEGVFGVVEAIGA